jgi:hypothetical protein
MIFRRTRKRERRAFEEYTQRDLTERGGKYRSNKPKKCKMEILNRLLATLT